MIFPFSRAALKTAPFRSMSTGNREWPGQTTRSVARRVMPRGRGSIKITKDVRKYAIEQGLAEGEAFKAGMAEKAPSSTKAAPSSTQKRKLDAQPSGC